MIQHSPVLHTVVVLRRDTDSVCRGHWHYTSVVTTDPDSLHPSWPRETHILQAHNQATTVYTARKPRRLMDSDRQHVPVHAWKQVVVLHVGAAYLVEVPEYGAGQESYDGASDGVINMGRWLFTYEYLQSFLTQLMFGTASFRGYLHHSLLNYVFSTGGVPADDRVREHILAQLHDLNKGSAEGGHKTGTQMLYKAFIGAVIDYIQLQVGRRCPWPRLIHSCRPLVLATC